MSAPMPKRGAHMNEFEVAAYLDRRLPASDRDRLERHLADCEDCRQEVSEIHRILVRGRRRRRILVGGVLLATAAALLLVVRPAVLASRGAIGTLQVRDAGSSPTLIAYGPSGEAALRSLRFVWGAAPGVTTYRLTVSGDDGVPVWTASVSDTVMILPDSVRLQAGRRYLWIADALLQDGATRSTGLREFQPTR